MDIQKRVNSHADCVDFHIKTSHQRVFTALYGSQNYGLADENSDIDTKSVIIPKLQTLVRQPTPYSSTYYYGLGDEGQYEIKDVRSMMECWMKQNVNFIEILFTDYVNVAEDYKDFYNFLITNREALAFSSPYQTLRATAGHIAEKYHKFKRKGIARAAVVEKYGYDPKQLCHAVRLSEFLGRFVDVVIGNTKETYKELLTPIPRDLNIIWDIKKCKLSLEQATDYMNTAFNYSNMVVEHYSEQFADLPRNTKIIELFNEEICKVIQEGIKKELAND